MVAEKPFARSTAITLPGRKRRRTRLSSLPENRWNRTVSGTGNMDGNDQACQSDTFLTLPDRIENIQSNIRGSGIAAASRSGQHDTANNCLPPA